MTVPSATFRYMFDSTTAADIPVGAAIVGGYIDGSYRWSDADWAMFPDAVKVRIAALASTNDGHVGDVEKGDMTANESVGWVQMRRAAGMDPTIYTSVGLWDAVRAAFKNAGVAEPHYWVAHYDNDPTPLYGAVAKQYANQSFTGKHYDASVVVGRWPGVEDDVLSQDQFNQWFDQRLAETPDYVNTVAAIKAVLTKLSAGEQVEQTELDAITARLDKLKTI